MNNLMSAFSNFKKLVSLQHLPIFLSFWFFFLSYCLKNIILHSAGFCEFFSMHLYHTPCPATCFHVTILQMLLPVSAHLYLPF